MHYYIDGYNLLFRILHTGEDLRKQREQLIQDLAQKVSLIELDTTLVFDSHYQEDDSTHSHVKSLKIVFTAKGETADQFIVQELKETADAQDETVVTSDKKLSWLCRLKFAKTMTVEDFVKWLNTRYRNKLRQKKTASKALKPIVSPIPKPQPPKSEAPPSKQAPAEDCFGFYLETFEKEFTELPELKYASPHKGSGKKAKKKSKLPSKAEDPFIRDMQRWLEAFEKNDSEES